MPHLSEFDKDRVARMLRDQHGIISRDQAVACAMTDKAIRHRTRPDGPWHVVLPGVYRNSHGALTAPQRAVAAYLYARKPIAVTGQAALAWHGIQAAARGELVDVLVPLSQRRSDAGFARLHRTSVPPRVLHRDGAVLYAAAERAVADAARQLTDLAEVRQIVAAGVQLGKVQVWQLKSELDSGPTRGSARLRAALAEVADGVRSTAEADLHTIITRAHLPAPMYNASLYVGDDFLAMVDAWWPDAAVVAEVDSKAWHLSPADWERTLVRHDRMTAWGILVLHFPPSRLRQAPREVAKQIRSALAASSGPLPQIVALPTV
jgi:very-short-patch-repair endonuclease